MAEEELKVEEEKEVSVGGEEELKVKQKKQEELLVKQKAAESEENPDDEEKEEASVENEPRETSPKKREHGKLPLVDDQDISTYLWKTLLKGVNDFNQWVYDWVMNGVDEGLSKRERGPASPKATKEEKIKHTKERGKGLYEEGKAENEAYASSVSIDKMPAELSGNIKLDTERENLKNVMVHAHRIAYDAAVSEFLYEKMSKDKDFSFAKTDKDALVKEIRSRVMEKHERLMSGVMATFYYSSSIEGQTPQETLESCEEYLKIRESETNDLKNLITKDLEAGNFASNDKKPSKDIGIKINAYNQSFAREAVILPSAVKEAMNLVKSRALSDKEKIGLQQLAETERNFRIFEETSVANIAVQRKAIDEAIKANRNNPLRSRITAMKNALGKNSVSAKMVQKYANNAILKAATSRNTGRK